MEKIAPGVFQVTDGEIITINAKSTGEKALFGVNYSIFGGGSALKEGKDLPIKMDKSKATAGSGIENAKSTNLTLLFSFLGDSGGKYEWTLTGTSGAPFNDSIEQGGATNAIFYTFHIV